MTKKETQLNDKKVNMVDLNLFSNDVSVSEQAQVAKNPKNNEIKNTADIKTDGPIEKEINTPKEDNSNEYYAIFSKGQIYTFLRKWYVTSWLESWEQDPIRSENFIKNGQIYLFKKNKLPNPKTDIIVKLEFDLNDKYINKNDKWEIIWLVWFLPTTCIKWIILRTDELLQEFKNPVPNWNDNFVVPNELCYLDEELYLKSTNPFYENWTPNVENKDEICKNIEHYARLLWWFFYANFNVYLSENSDNYWESYIKFLQEIYQELSKDLDNPKANSYNMLLSLAYSWELSNVQNIDELCNLLLNKNILNISDFNYIKSSYKATIWWFQNFEEFFTHKENDADNITRQIISFLAKFCWNKSLEERSLDLSNSLAWRNKIINPRVSFIFWLCCLFSNIVCEIKWDEKALLQWWKKKMKDISSPIRKKIVDDVYNFVVNQVSLPSRDEPNLIDTIQDNNTQWVIVIKKSSLLGEEYTVTKDFTFKEAYLMKIKKIYWKDFEKLTKWTYLMSLILKNNKNDWLDIVENLLDSYLDWITSKNEELDQILELDQKYNIK